MKQVKSETVAACFENYESLFYRANGYDIDQFIERVKFVIARRINGIQSKKLRNEIWNWNVTAFE